MAGLEYLKLYILDCHFQHDPFYVFRNHFSQIFHYHFIVSQHSFLQDSNHWIFDDDGVMFVDFGSRGIKVVEELFIVCENIVDLAFDDLIDKCCASFPGCLNQSCNSTLEVLSINWKLSACLAEHFINQMSVGLAQFIEGVM